MAPSYCPKRGDVIWLSFSPQAGHEQGGHRPALTLSSEGYNRKVGLALVCPITTKSKGYPFEVPLPPGLKISGIVKSDQVKSFDWEARKAQFSCKVPATTLDEVLRQLDAVLNE
jgi:mRNA interferase MazF